MTFCHAEKDEKAGTAQFVLNYIRWDEINGTIQKKYPSIHVRIREFYKRFHKAEGLIGQFASNHLTMALEKCGFYPEKDGKY